MTSRNSFWASLKENNKRRIWIWIVSGLLWFLYYPVSMAMLMGRKIEHNHMDNLTGEAAKLRLTEAAGEWLAAGNAVAAVLVAGTAIVCAIQGFSYLYSRKKVDMYHSVPVKKSRRFAVVFINGVLIYFIPYLVNLLLAVLVAGVSGGMNGAILQQTAIAVLLNIVLYLGVFALATVAVMLTGNLIITIFAAMTFLGYELVIKLLSEALKTKCFSYFCSYSSDTTMYTSPIYCFGKAASMIKDTGGNTGTGFGDALPYVLAGLLLAAIFSGIAYFCYSKRPAEAAGKAMAFEKTKAIVKLLLTVPFSLGVALVVDSIVVSGAFFVIFGAALAVIVSNCVIEVIYEADIKAAFRKKYQILISGGCAAVIACIFIFDLTGYDAWMPSPEKLQDAVFLFPNTYYGQSYLDENLQNISIEDYALSKPGVTDVEAICELSAKKAGEGGDESTSYMWVDVAYRMKSGKVVWRSFPVSTEEDELLDRITGSEEYKKMIYQAYDDTDYERMAKQEVEEVTYTNGFRVVNLSPEEVSTIRELWKKDMANMSYTDFRDEFKCGGIEIERKARRRNNSYYIDNIAFNVYPSSANLRKYLEEKGIGTESYVDIEQIASITVTNRHTEEERRLYEERRNEMEEAEALMSVNREDLTVTKVFTEEEQIKELVNAMYPSRLSTWWKRPGTFSDDYEVEIQYKNGEADSSAYRGSTSARLIADRIPDWLEKETAYQ